MPLLFRFGVRFVFGVPSSTKATLQHVKPHEEVTNRRYVGYHRAFAYLYVHGVRQ